MNSLTKLKRNFKFIKKKQIPHTKYAKVVSLFTGKRKNYYILNLRNYELQLKNTFRFLQTLIFDKQKILFLSEFTYITPFLNKNIYQYKQEWSPGLFFRAIRKPKKEKLIRLPNILLTFSNTDDFLIAIKEAIKLNIITFTFTQLDKELYYKSHYSTALNHDLESHSKMFYLILLSKLLYLRSSRAKYYFNRAYSHIKKSLLQNEKRKSPRIPVFSDYRYKINKLYTKRLKFTKTNRINKVHLERKFKRYEKKRKFKRFKKFKKF